MATGQLTWEIVRIAKAVFIRLLRVGSENIDR
ncbi:hypothetical protein COLO4_22645 [Corchorus olitorius]|uniref:Uncharacterized protein n=1 Tax=Corchorus olitorius TaxID=93759 RepID=A0A1R3IKQ8_9ROSI|nr:hypothetical protein COLO4_22645 [Corchorus olitorius]